MDTIKNILDLEQTLLYNGAEKTTKYEWEESYDSEIYTIGNHNFRISRSKPSYCYFNFAAKIKMITDDLDEFLRFIEGFIQLQPIPFNISTSEDFNFKEYLASNGVLAYFEDMYIIKNILIFNLQEYAKNKDNAEKAIIIKELAEQNFTYSPEPKANSDLEKYLEKNKFFCNYKIFPNMYGSCSLYINRKFLNCKEDVDLAVRVRDILYSLEKEGSESIKINN